MGSVLQQAGGGRCNGRVASPRRNCRSPPHTPPGDRDMEDGGYSQGYTSQNSHLHTVNTMLSVGIVADTGSKVLDQYEEVRTVRVK